MRLPCSTAVKGLFHYCGIAVSQLWNSPFTYMEQQKVTYTKKGCQF